MLREKSCSPVLKDGTQTDRDSYFKTYNAIGIYFGPGKLIFSSNPNPGNEVAHMQY